MRSAITCVLSCIVLLFESGTIVHAQERTDEAFKKMIFDRASPELLRVLQSPDTFRYQLIYTQIDRDKNNKPVFTHRYLRLKEDEYFNPASTVKLPLALLALEKINILGKYGITRNTTMLTDSAFLGQTRVWADSSAPNGMPSLGHYIKKIFLVSDNDAYNRLYEFIGQQQINEVLWRKGFSSTRITRRFVPMNEEQNRHTNPVIFGSRERVLYQQAAATSNIAFDFSRKIFVGKAHYDRNEKLVAAPMEFTTHNALPLHDLQQLLQATLFPESVPYKKRFNISPENYGFLYRCMSQYPGESRFPKYDTTEYFPGYTKFFMYRAGKSTIPNNIRVFNKAGWSYGFLTDAAYIVDFAHQVEFMLTATIYVNSDQVLNDDKYDYDNIGYPFFREIGEIVYHHELARKRKHLPDLARFRLDYRE